jgi:hypothetical protein
MSRTKPLDDFRPEESPVAWFMEMLIAIDRGNWQRASESQGQLERLGWKVKRTRPVASQPAARQGGGA